MVHMGNGTCLSIKHIGNTLISSFDPSRSHSLKNILHVITKNLVSVSQFKKDNNVFIEFHSSTCFVKDQVTKVILLQGTLQKGLYRFNFFNKARGAFGKTSKILVFETRNLSSSSLSHSSSQDFVFNN